MTEFIWIYAFVATLTTCGTISNKLTQEKQLKSEHKQIIDLNDKLQAASSELVSCKEKVERLQPVVANPAKVEATTEDEPKFDAEACKSQCELDFQACMKSTFSNGNFDSGKSWKCDVSRGHYSLNYSDSCLGKCYTQQRTLEQYLQSVKETSKKDKP